MKRLADNNDPIRDHKIRKSTHMFNSITKFFLSSLPLLAIELVKVILSYAAPCIYRVDSQKIVEYNVFAYPQTSQWWLSLDLTLLPNVSSNNTIVMRNDRYGYIAGIERRYGVVVSEPSAQIICIDISHNKSIWNICMDVERAHYCMLILNNELYVLGGTIQWFCTTNDCVKYDLSENIWTRIKPMNKDRDLAAAVSYNNEKIFIFGGRSIYNANCICCSTCESYNVNTSIWEIICPLPQPRCSAHASVVTADYILIIGGICFDEIESNESICDTVLLYQPQANTFTTLPWRLPKKLQRDQFYATVLFSSYLAIISYTPTRTWIGSLDNIRTHIEWESC